MLFRSRVGDVGRAEYAFQNFNQAAINAKTGHPCVGFGVIQLPGSNAISTAKAVDDVLTQFRSTLPPGVVLDVPAVDAVTAWIADGAPTTCAGPVPDAAVVAPPDAGLPEDALLPAGDGLFCAAAPILVRECSACHHPGGNSPDLTLAGLADQIGRAHV